MAEAMTIGWTQNVVILEADLTLQEKFWYIQAAKQFRWSKLTLLEKIKAGVHTEVSLDFQDAVCYTEKNSAEMGNKRDDKDTFYLPRQYTSKPRNYLILLDFRRLLLQMYYLFTTFRGQNDINCLGTIELTEGKA